MLMQKSKSKYLRMYAFVSCVFCRKFVEFGISKVKGESSWHNQRLIIMHTYSLGCRTQFHGSLVEGNVNWNQIQHYGSASVLRQNGGKKIHKQKKILCFHRRIHYLLCDPNSDANHFMSSSPFKLESSKFIHLTVPT